jgi:hypothetical protein
VFRTMCLKCHSIPIWNLIHDSTLAKHCQYPTDEMLLVVRTISVVTH